MIEIKPGRYYIALWCLEVPKELHPPRGGNIMACCWRVDSEPTTWHIQYRHRYYSDETCSEMLAASGKSRDRFSWFEFTKDGDHDQAKASAELVMAKIQEAATTITGEPHAMERFDIEGDVNKWFERVSNNPPKWMNHFVRIEEKAS